MKKTLIRGSREKLGLKSDVLLREKPVSLKFHFIAVLFIFISILLGYGYTLNYAFHFDDLISFVDVPANHLKELTWNNVSIILHGNRPVANLSFALNYYFDRLETRGYHLVNIMVHISTTFAVYLLFLKTLSLPGMRETGFGMGKPGYWIEHRGKIALMAALLWGIHPVQTQAVTYVSQRMASLAAFFYLSSLLFYIYGRVTVGGGAWRWFSLSAVFGLLAFGTKENSLTLPLVIFLYDLFFISRFKIHLSRKEPFILTGLFAGGALGVFYIISTYQGTHTLAEMLLSNYGTEDMDPLLRVMSEWRVVIFYISLLLLPIPSRMNLDPDFPLSRGLFDPMTTFFSLLAILFLLGFAISKARKFPILSFSILWFFINLAIESTFIKLDLVFEHRLYLPSIILFLPLMMGIYLLALRYPARNERVVIAIVAFLAASLLYMTHERNKVWKNGVSLWSDVALKSPNKSRAFNNLGRSYLDVEQWDLAKNNFIQAIKLDPKNQNAINNLGNAYLREQKYDLAIKAYQKVLDLNRNNFLGHNDLGIAYQAVGKNDLAIKEFLEAVRLNPNSGDAHNNLGNMYLLSNQLDLAAINYQKTIDLNPKHSTAHANLGLVYQQQGKVKEAAEEFGIGVKLDPHSSFAQSNYGSMMEMMDRKNEAISHYEEAIKWAAPDDAARMEIVRQRLKELKG